MVNRGRRFYGLYGIVLLLLIAAGRGIAVVYSHVAVDIAYAAWMADALEWAVELLEVAKYACGWGVIAWTVWHRSMGAGWGTATVMFGCLAAECAARFLIDWFSSALVYYGVPLASVVLAIRLAVETALVLLVLLIAWGCKRLQQRGKLAISCSWTARIPLILFGVIYLVDEVVYLVEFMALYEMTATDITSAVSSFLHIIVVRLVVPLLLCQVTLWFCNRMAAKSADSKTQDVRSQANHGQ